MAAAARRASAAESITNAAVMASAGGFLDAFNYVGHGHGFANAMTGNVVLLVVALARLERTQALRRLVPICAFIAGVHAARLALMRPLSRFRANPRLFWHD